MLLPVFLVALAVCATKIVTAAPPAAVATMNDPFEGHWIVTLEPDEDARHAGEKGMQDTLTFQGGKFSSQEFKKRGFEPVDYDEDTRRFGPATFTALGSSKTDGKIKWTGTSTASALSGDVTWTRKDGTEIHFSYKGERKQ
jgi:hypothetical protein